MSQNDIPASETNDPVRTGVPLKWGLLTGFIAILLTTINYTFLLKPSTYAYFVALGIVTFGVTVVMYGMAGLRQRAALGGYISLRQAFSAIFIVILISTIMASLYGVLYATVIDVNTNDKLKESTVAFLERQNIPEEVIDQRVEAFEENAANSLKPTQLIYAIASQIVGYSVVGFICALIVRRKRPVFPE